MGRSRGGLTTKIHALVDANGNPIALKLTEGQAHDGKARAICSSASVPARPSSPIAPMTAMPPREPGAAWRPGQRQTDAEPRQLPAFSPFLYRYRNLVERFFNKIKHFRAVATRFEKHDANYLAIVKLAAARIWMRFMSR